MKNILITIDTFYYGGTQQSIIDKVKNFDKREFTFFAIGHDRCLDMISEWREVFSEVIILKDGANFEGIEKVIDKFNIDLAHVTESGRYYDHIKRISKKVPVLQEIMCPRSDEHNYDDVEVVTVPSVFSYGLLKGDKGKIIEHPLDIDSYIPKYDKKYFNLPEDKLIIGSLGNAHDENEDFVDIANQFKDNEDLFFVIKTSRKDLPQGNYLLINEFITQEEKISLMNCFDIFLYPTHFEAYGVVFLEANAMKKPIISYDDSSASRDTIGNGGLTVPYRNKKKMIKALEWFIEDDEIRRYYGETGFLQVKSRNNPKKIAEEYEKIYRQILAQN